MESTIDTALLSRIEGALYGQLLGDAMGMPSELWPRERVKAHFGWIDDFLDGPPENEYACYFKAGQYTDDTAMALAAIEALRAREGAIDPTLIGRKILEWAIAFGAFHKNILGPSSRIALQALRDGASIDSLENKGLSNGAAMRAAPLGCLLPPVDADDFIEQVALASSPTHKSDIAIAGAVTIAWTVSRLVQGAAWQDTIGELPAIADQAQQRRINTFSPSLAARLDLAINTATATNNAEDASEKIYRLVGAGVPTIESVPAAIGMAMIAGSDPERCAILCANLGGDTDTIGAMATAICGAFRGVDAISATRRARLDAVNELDLVGHAAALAQYRVARIDRRGK